MSIELNYKLKDECMNKEKLWLKQNLPGNILNIYYFDISSADLEVQLVQLNHCDGEYSNY